MTLRLRTFGGVFLERDGTPLGGAHSQRRRLALLAYLAAADRATISRETLVALLWPESDESSGRHSLSQLLYALRRDLGADSIAVDSETARLNHAAVASDVRVFDAAIRGGRSEEAVAEYQGAFLDGFHVDDAPELNRWVDEARTRRAHDCARALDRLAGAAEKSHDWHRAADWLRRLVTLDATDSRSTIRLMQSLSAIGDRENALRAARVYDALVRDGMEAAPDPAVLRFAEELRRVPTLPGATPPTPEAPGVPTRAGDVEMAPSEDAVAPPAQGDRWYMRLATTRWAIAATAFVLLAVFLVAQVDRGAASEGSQSPDARGVTVVIGDIEGPDSALSLAVREALRAELANRDGVRLTSDAGVREIRILMRLPRDAPLRPPQLLALATRGGAHVAVAGSVVPIGAGAQIVLQLLDPASGRSMRTFTERPVDGPSTLAAVERIGGLIGTAVSRAPLDETVRPLPAVTTSSLAALKSYALGRQAVASGNRGDAVRLAERALAHDSTFVLAHYFLGDLLWFIDEQRHSEAHLTRAYELLGTVPAREQLIIRARYEQLTHDQPDSALAYWQLLADAYPGDALAYEGRTWALRALGRYEEAAAAADTAMSLDPGALLPNVTNAMYSWLSVGDTANAQRVGLSVGLRYPAALVEAHYYTALFREPAAALAWADSTVPEQTRHWRRHLAQVAMGDVASARTTLDSVIKDGKAQFPPNALLNQAWLELGSGQGQREAARYTREALEWIRQRDLSPPAIGRLSERIADLAARAGDEATVQATIAFVRERDRDRSMRTYVMVLRALDAALAYVRRDFSAAAQRAEAARNGVYFSRSLATIVQLEADARRAAGQSAVADSLARLVATHQIVDGNFETWAILRALNARRSGVVAQRASR